MEQEFFIKADDVSLKKIKYLENIIGLMPGHVYWKDRDCILQGCNDQQAFDIGLNSRDEIVGKSAYDILWQDQPEEAKREQAAITDKMDKDVMSSGTAVIIEESVVLSNGETAVFLSTKKPIKNEDGEVVGLFGISVDITERKKIELELAKAKEEAQRANAGKSNFLAALDRAVRNSLSPALGYSQLLQRYALNPEETKLVDSIVEALEEIPKLFVDVRYYLDLIDHGEETMEFYDFKTLRCFQGVAEKHQGIVEEYKALAETKGLRFNFTYDPNIPVWAKGRSHFITFITAKLLSNAIKYTSKGFVSLTIAMVKREGEAFRLRVTIEDTGRGLRSETQDCLFNLLEQDASAISFTEAGLTLSICAKTAEVMGGTLTVSSRIHHGSCFVLEVPLVLGEPQLESPLDEKRYAKEIEPKLKRPRDSNIQVLIVEDHEMIQFLLVTLLKHNYHCTTTCVSTLEEARKEIGKPYDIILTDISLPDGTGIDFIKDVLRQMGNKAPPIVAITGYVKDEQKDLIERSGVTDVMEKPVDVAMLYRVIDGYVFEEDDDDDDEDD